MTDAAARSIRVTFRPGWGAPEGKGLLHILPDRISLDAAAEPHLLDTVARFLQRQEWLVQSVEIR